MAQPVAQTSIGGRPLAGVLDVVRRRAVLILLTAAPLIAVGAMLFALSPPVYRATAYIEAALNRVPADPAGPRATPEAEQAAIRTQTETITTRLVPRVVGLLSLDKDPEFNPGLEQPSRFAVRLPEVWTAWLRSRFSSGEAVEPEQRRNLVIDIVGQRLEATVDSRSQVIRVSFSSEDPEKAARITNAFADEFIVDQLATRKALDQEMAAQIGGRLDELRNRLKAAEAAANEYRERAALIPVGPDGTTATTQQLTQFNQQLVQAQVERAQAEARLQQARESLRTGAVPDSAAAVLSSPLIQKLKEQEADIGRREAEMRSVYGPQHPRIINSQAELRDIRSKITQEIRHISQGISNEVAVAQAKEQTLRSKITSLETSLAKGARADLQYQDLQREVQSSRKLYEDFVTRLKDVDVQQGMAVATARVIDQARVPVRPTPPGKTVRLGIVVFVSLLIAMLVAFVRDRMNRAACTAAELEEATGYRTIAFIPAIRSWGRSKPVHRVLQEPQGEFADALQAVRARMQQSLGRLSPFMLVVTSSVPEEGKSVFCVSFARLLARCGYRVLLVDADLRRPQIGKLLGDHNRGSLGDVVAGTKAFTDIVHKDAGSGADYLVAYGTSGDAQSTFAPKVMRSFRILRDYDVVLFDTPPIGALPDAGIVAQSCDAALFLVRWGKTPREVVADSLRQFSDFGANILGAVFTRVDLRSLPKYDAGNAGYYHKHYRRYYSPTRGSVL